MKSDGRGIHCAMLALAATLATAVLPGSAGAQRAGSGGQALAPLRLVTPATFDSAVAHGTRTRTGVPGRRYWQNSADYTIAATVTPADSMLRGEEAITYRNESPDTLRHVVFHLYQNLMAAEAARESPAPAATGGMRIELLQIGDRSLAVPENRVGQAPDSAAPRVYGTLMLVALPRPIPPGASERFHLKWSFTIPGDWAPRMGMVNTTTAQIAQWYPQIAVYDDLHGWDLQQYTGTGEFYLDYGHFRYSVTIPAGYIVGGSGTLTNADQVLTQAERAALARAAGSDDVQHVVTAAGFGAGRATAGAAGSSLTWSFDADSVRDVAFSFSDHYLWDATSAVVDSATGRRALVNVMYREGAPLFDQVWKMARAALETHSSRMVPYPWPQLTETEGGSGGMEYPMTVFVQAYPDLYREDEVSAHEIGHEWFPMLVGSNETRYGWQDEGLNTFDTFFATDAFLPDSLQRRGVEENATEYLDFIRTEDEDLPMMSPANAFGVLNAGYGVEAYAKPSTALWVLYKTLGHDAFYKAYRAYIHAWEYRHPTPWDFFDTFDHVTGQDLDPFWHQWFFTRDRLDQAITGVTQAAGSVRVTVANAGRIYAPIDITATLAGGKKVSWRVPVTVWYDGRARTTPSHEVSGRVTRVELDAAHDFPDVDRANNVWPR